MRTIANVVDAALAARCQQVVVHLAAAEDDALDLLRIDLVHFADHRLEAAVGEILQRRHRFLVPQQALRASR